MTAKLEVMVGDITQLSVDVVVNAANSRLAGGGGVDGAIHRAAGAQELQAACRQLGGCPAGDVRETSAFRMPAKAIFHTVGPVWHGGAQGEPELLASCYRSCLKLAGERGFDSIAFPAISCGVYGYPHQKAAALAVETVQQTLIAMEKPLQRVIFCCFDDAMASLYRDLLG